MTNEAKNELGAVQASYDDRIITYQEFKDKAIALIVARSDVKDIEDIVSGILEN